MATPRLVCAALVILLAVKFGVLLIIGPTVQLDSSGYLTYADAILTGDFRHVDLATDPMPVTLTRMIGYPAVIAAAKILAGRDWTWAVVLFQFAVSLWATVMVYRLARAFRLGVWISLAVVAAQATSMQFMVDQAGLTASLTGSTVTIATCILGLIVLRRAAAPLPVYLGAGALIAVAFLMRDVIAFLAVGLAPLAGAAALGAGGAASPIGRVRARLPAADRDPCRLYRMEPCPRRLGRGRLHFAGRAARRIDRG